MPRKNTMISKKSLEESSPKKAVIKSFVETGSTQVATTKARETKRLTLTLDLEVHTALKMKAFSEGTTMKNIVEALVLKALEEEE